MLGVKLRVATDAFDELLLFGCGQVQHHAQSVRSQHCLGAERVSDRIDVVEGYIITAQRFFPWRRCLIQLLNAEVVLMTIHVTAAIRGDLNAGLVPRSPISSTMLMTYLDPHGVLCFGGQMSRRVAVRRVVDHNRGLKG